MIQRRISILFALCLATCASLIGCMKLDDDDLAASAKNPEYVRWYMNHRGGEWLRANSKNDKDRVTYVVCKHSDDAGVTWPRWQILDQYSKTVGDVLACLENVALLKNYEDCTSLTQEALDAEHYLQMGAIMSGMTNVRVECRQQFQQGFSLDEVPKDVVDPDAISPDDIISAFLRAAPPFAGGALPIPFPVLCPLGVDGCPNHPDESFGNGQGDNAGSTGGDP